MRAGLTGFPAFLILSEFSWFCLKIWVPTNIRWSNILWYLWFLNQFLLTYTRTPNRVYWLTYIQKTLKNRVIYKTRLSTCMWSYVNINTHENDNQFSEHFRQELSPQNTRNGISEHQEFKICRGACRHKLLAACAFSNHEIHQWLKNIPIKVGQSSGLVRLLVNLSEENRSH